MTCNIKKEGNCGSYGLGRTDYLVNPSGIQKFRVLVRTTKSYGDPPLIKDNVYIVEPWDRIELGCDQVHGSTPTINYTRELVNEVAL